MLSMVLFSHCIMESQLLHDGGGGGALAVNFVASLNLFAVAEGIGYGKHDGGVVVAIDGDIMAVVDR